MYLKHFGIKEMPFSITPNTDYFLNVSGGQDLINILLFSLNNGEGFLKVVGEVGTGKTLLCRKLLSSLDKSFKTAYIASPCFSDKDIFLAVATELGVKVDSQLATHDVLHKLHKHLISMHKKNKKVVLIIDEAQALNDTALEAIRLLTNLETETKKLLQVVLVGQPELDVRLEKPHMRQLKQRIVFSLNLKELNRDELDVYINYRLYIAGYKKKNLFSKSAINILHMASKGTPRIINIISHKALLAAFGDGSPTVSEEHVKKAIADTDYIDFSKLKWIKSAVFLLLIGVASSYIAHIIIGGYL